MTVRAWAIVAAITMGSGVAAADTPAPKANCALFKRASDGRWMSTVASRIGNPKSFVTLEPGIPIDRSQEIFGMNVSETLDRLCGK